MAWPFDQLDPGFGPNYMPPQVSAQGGFDPSVGGMMPGFGAQAPGSDTPDFGPTTQQAVPQDYWARMAQASGAHPFSDIHFTQHTPGGGGLALLALLSAIGNAKAAHAANRVATIEEQNKQARENAKALAEHRWRSRENQAQRDAVMANLAATQKAAAALKKTPAELGADAGAVETARMAALKAAGGEPPGSSAESGESVMTPRALKARVSIFRAGGAEPSFGMGKAGVANRVAFNEELAKQLEAEGITGADVMEGRATQAAEKANLANLVKQLGTITTAHETVRKNVDVLKSTLPKLPDTGSPLANAFVRPGMEKVFGSKDVTDFNNALGTVQLEFARILNSAAAGNVPLTDQAKSDLKASLGKSFTKRQLLGALAIYEKDAGNRIGSQQEEIDATKKRLSHIGVKRSSPPSDGKVRWGRDATGKPVPIQG